MTTEHPTTHATARVKKTTTKAATTAKKTTKKAAGTAKTTTAKAASAATATTRKAAETAKASSSHFTLPGVDLPKFDLPKFEVPKFEVPKFEVPKFDRSTLSELAAKVHVPAVGAWAGEARTRAHDTAASVKGGVTHTVTLLREAVGV